MKYILPILLLLCAACKKTEVVPCVAQLSHVTATVTDSAITVYNTGSETLLVKPTFVRTDVYITNNEQLPANGSVTFHHSDFYTSADSSALPYLLTDPSFVMITVRMEQTECDGGLVETLQVK